VLTKNKFRKFKYIQHAGLDLPIGCVGLSLGPQDPRGPPANCDAHGVNCRSIISSTNIRQKFMS